MTVRYIHKLLIPAAFTVILSLTGCANSAGAPMLTRYENAGGGKTEGGFADLTVAASDDVETAVLNQLGSFSTQFNPKNKNRSHNITRAAGAVDNSIIKPGETFSYNETVGPTSAKYGYKLSTVFFRGTEKKGYGGGVCQVSSTLYNAAVNAGMTIVERHDHSLPVPYIEKGKEAATSYGGIDLKFTNNKNYPVRINTRIDGGELSVSLNAV